MIFLSLGHGIALFLSLITLGKECQVINDRFESCQLFYKYFFHTHIVDEQLVIVGNLSSAYLNFFNVSEVLACVLFNIDHLFKI